MLLSLKNNHKQHLQLLTIQSTQVVVDFCKLALDFLQNGPNVKRYELAAQKLDVTGQQIQNAVEGLINLLLESCKYSLSTADFRDSALTLGFDEKQVEVLNQFYQTKHEELLHILAKNSVKLPHYHDLDWRFEVQLASRSLLKQATPLITMSLALQSQPDSQNITQVNDSKEIVLLQTDPCNLVHMTEVLEQALAETRSQHFRRIQRTFKTHN